MSQDAWIDAIIPEVTMDDIPENYRQVAAAIGIEAAVKLSRAFGGLACYVPQVEALLRKKRDAAIRRAFNGRNHRALAVKYGLTEVWIRDIVDRKASPADQQGLF